jgi:hypothetical protein
VERWWAYQVPSPQAAYDAVTALDAFPGSLVGGLGVVARGYEGDPELYYVFINANDPSPDDLRQIEAVASRFGSVTDLTLDGLMYTDPRPHLIASGPVEDIQLALRTQFLGQINELSARSN